MFLRLMQDEAQRILKQSRNQSPEKSELPRKLWQAISRDSNKMASWS